MSTIQDTDLLLVNRGGTDYKVKAEDLYEYFNPDVVVYHIINLQNVTGSPDPLQAKVWGGILENLTTGEREEVDGRTNFELTEGNEYLITLPGGANVEFLENDIYTWDFGPKCDTKRMTSLAYLVHKNCEFDGDMSNLDVSNVTNMVWAFSGGHGKKMKISMKGVEKWNTSKVQEMGNTFQDIIGLDDLTPLKDWDVSSVKALLTSFSNSTFKSAKAIEGWNTKSVTRAGYCFQGCDKMTEVADFSQWCMPLCNSHDAFSNRTNGMIIEPVWETCPRGEDKE